MTTAEPIRVINAGLVSPVRSQSLYHAVAYTMDQSTSDTIILVSPTEPYVSIGVHQELEKEVDTDYCHAKGLPVIRREIGGGAVYLDSNQLFVQWVFRRGHLPPKVTKHFELFVTPLIATYRDFGIEAYFRPINDVHVAGKKIGGTGAARIASADVVVGSFMFDFDRATMAGALKVSSEKMRDKIAEALAQYVTTMRDLLGEVPSREKVVAKYLAHCEAGLGRPTVAGRFSPREIAKAEALDEMLASPGWLHQKGGLQGSGVKIHEDVYVAEAVRKAPGGLVRVSACLDNGQLGELTLSGDFTMVPTDGLRRLEEVLVGSAVDRHALERRVAEVYEQEGLQSPGIEPADIVETLLLLARE